MVTKTIKVELKVQKRTWINLEPLLFVMTTRVAHCQGLGIKVGPLDFVAAASFGKTWRDTSLQGSIGVSW